MYWQPFAVGTNSKVAEITTGCSVRGELTVHELFANASANTFFLNEIVSTPARGRGINYNETN